MDGTSKSKHSNAIHPLPEYSPSPSSSKNDTPTTANTVSISTPNSSPNPIAMLPNSANVQLLSHSMTFQPLLTSMNPINHHQETDSKQPLHDKVPNVPRIPLPKVAMPSLSNFTSCNLALPPLPSDFAADLHSKGPLSINHNRRNISVSHSES